MEDLSNPEIAKGIVSRLRSISNKRIYASAHYARNKQVYLTRAKEYDEKYPERALARHRRYNATERARGLQSIRRHRRRALEYNASGEHTPEEWLEKKGVFRNKCAWCGKRTLQLTKDHIIPLCDGGSNDIVNIVPACKHCNMSRGRKLINPVNNQSLMRLNC